ncbi:SIP domain-containing protein [Streptomyces sp. NPDC048279]|uniref:SIP domain-containing protein n=1 Tax=Streptomyces sp. NPDC048279 TaxID=3154714 RepID=UPI00341FD29A
MESTAGAGQLLAISDLHISYPENRELVEKMRPGTDDDWLIVAGDVAETVADIRWVLETFADRFAKVLWAPGNHDLWTHPKDPVTLRGVARYEHLVALCRELGVVSPEDPYPVWEGPGGPVVVAPLFLLYDYSFLPAGCTTKEEGLAYAHGTGIVCNDEYLLLGPAVADNRAIRFRPPEDTDLVLIWGDDTAVPAATAIIESLPAGARVRAWLEVPHAGDVQDVATAADAEIDWVVGTTAEAAIRGARLPAAERPYVWIAGESGRVKELRRHFVGERGVDRRRVTFAGYWRQGLTEEQLREAGE